MPAYDNQKQDIDSWFRSRIIQKSKEYNYIEFLRNFYLCNKKTPYCLKKSINPLETPFYTAQSKINARSWIIRVNIAESSKPYKKYWK